MFDTEKYNIDDNVVWVWNDFPDDEGWVLWEYKECPDEKGGYTLMDGRESDKTYEPWFQVLPALKFECDIDERMHAIMDLPLIIKEVERLRGLLDAIYWDAFSEDDTTLEIDREVAERIRRG